MIAVIFELEPRPGASQRFFELAAELRSELQSIDGFISVERFESLAKPAHYLSLSYWRDEAAVRQWRCHALHRRAQHEGRASVLGSYSLRVATIVREYGMHDREQAPPDSRAAFIC